VALRDWSSSCISPVFFSKASNRRRQVAHVAGEFFHIEQLAAARHHHVLSWLASCAWLPASTAAAIRRVMSSRMRPSFVAQLAAHLVEAVAGKVLVEVIGASVNCEGL